MVWFASAYRLSPVPPVLTRYRRSVLSIAYSPFTALAGAVNCLLDAGKVWPLRSRVHADTVPALPQNVASWAVVAWLAALSTQRFGAPGA